MAEWITNPARLTGCSLRTMTSPSVVDLDEVGGRHLVVAEAVGVDQEVRLRPRHARRQMAVDQFGPAEVVDQAVGRGQLHPERLLGLARSLIIEALPPDHRRHVSLPRCLLSCRPIMPPGDPSDQRHQRLCVRSAGRSETQVVDLRRFLGFVSF